MKLGDQCRTAAWKLLTPSGLLPSPPSRPAHTPQTSTKPQNLGNMRISDLENLKSLQKEYSANSTFSPSMLCTPKPRNGNRSPDLQ